METAPHALRARDRAGRRAAGRATSRTAHAQPRQTHGLRATVVGVVALLIAGSLYPFDCRQPPSFADAGLALLSDRALATSTGDALGNLAPFVPLGFAARCAFPGERTPHIAVALVGMLEAAQTWLTGRVPDVTEPLLVLIIGVLVQRMPVVIGQSARRRAPLGTAGGHRAPR